MSWHSYWCLVAVDGDINLGCGVYYYFGFGYADEVELEVQKLQDGSEFFYVELD